ncbi:hypothetical protein [Pelovirga terrestris]|uniref:ABC transporter ATP-binding protein n=1 Tax=Pelovirga terrestris TaxID=2771352 RepID=A0A8J6QPQ4_9BACT|nr:hypothetical protein [Pelovirga terrestris]MBD1400526.1 hypothetical protein [Pelovirga terrestris]
MRYRPAPAAAPVFQACRENDISRSQLQELRRQFAPTILFVTHDVSEALLLGDRILLFEKNPGRISHDIEIDLEKPRTINNDAFLRLRTHINERLKDK